jgi:hypothetical protein
MKRPYIFAGAAAIVALVVIAFAVVASGDDENTPIVENPPLPTAPSDGSGAAGVCPAADVPGISDEERERCFEQDSPGGGASSPDDPVTNDPSTPQTPPLENKLPGLPDDRRAVEAPIEGLEILTLESFPPQYMLHVQAGLSSGCAEQYGSEVERVDDVITVTVLNTIPADEKVVCTMIYGTYEFNMSLGSDFESGETYTVKVNDKEIRFTAQ